MLGKSLSSSIKNSVNVLNTDAVGSSLMEHNSLFESKVSLFDTSEALEIPAVTSDDDEDRVQRKYTESDAKTSNGVIKTNKNADWAMVDEEEIEKGRVII